MLEEFLKDLLWHDMRPTRVPGHFPLATAVPKDVATEGHGRERNLPNCFVRVRASFSPGNLVIFLRFFFFGGCGVEGKGESYLDVVL